MSQTVVVVGGAGKTGSKLCQIFAEAGIKPVVFDDLSTGLSERIQHGPLVKVDAKQTPRVLRTLKEHGSKILVHAALLKTSHDPLQVFDQNLSTTMSLLKALIDQKEKGSLLLVNPPALTKEMLQRILDDCATAYGLKVHVVTTDNAQGLSKTLELVKELY